MFIDSHTHFNMCIEDKSSLYTGIVSSLKDNKIEYAVQVSTEVEEFDWSYNFAKKNDNIFFTLGIHPSSKASENELNILSGFVQDVISAGNRALLFGIGEFGLDYYRMEQPKNNQIIAFEYQLDLAEKYKLPVIIHSREALDDTLSILKKKKPCTGIMHCFSGDSRAAKEFLDLGFYISFAGNLTYKKADILHDAARYVPLDRLLLETDAPFLTPVPLRGKKNLPEYVIHTYRFIADLRKEDQCKIEDSIVGNFNNIISLNK